MSTSYSRSRWLVARSGWWHAAAVEREARLAAQPVREVIDEHLACRLLVVRPQVEVVPG